MVAIIDLDTVGVWESATNRLVQTFEAGMFAGGLISPDGSVAFTFQDEAGRPNGRFWDVETGQELRSLEHLGGILGAVFSPDGRYVLASGRDSIARIWDVDSASVVRELEGHTNIMWRVAWSPDGRYVFTTSQDKSARMWDAETGQQLRYFPGHALSSVADIAVAPDGVTVAIGSYDGTTQLALTDVGTLMESVCERLLRDFTPEERVIYGITDERPTCPSASVDAS